MGIGLLLLIVDAEAGLKDPLRFIYLFMNFNSVMTIGTYFISLFMVAAAYIALIEILKKDIMKIAEYVGIVFAVASHLHWIPVRCYWCFHYGIQQSCQSCSSYLHFQQGLPVLCLFQRYLIKKSSTMSCP